MKENNGILGEQWISMESSQLMKDYMEYLKESQRLLDEVTQEMMRVKADNTPMPDTSEMLPDYWDEQDKKEDDEK